MGNRFYGPYTLDMEGIVMVPKNTPGVYVLGKSINSRIEIEANYVGRSDSSVQERLKTWIDNDRGYVFFIYQLFGTATEAFYAECDLYHTLPDLDNDIHPDVPSGKTLMCPVCKTIPK